MKKLIRIIPIIIILISCQEDDSIDKPTDFGYLSMNIVLSIEKEVAGSRVEAVSTDNWSVTIFNASDDTEVISFTPFIDAPSEIQLPTGEYYIEVHSNNFQEAAFENPYYFGRSDNFTIDKEELKTVNIDAELANSKVAINYSANVTSTFNEYTGDVTVVSTGATLPYVQGETREGYFVAEPLLVVVNLSYTKLDGTFITRQFTADIDAKPKTLYNINVDATLEDGEIMININVDEGFETVEIELGDANPDPNEGWIVGDDWFDPRDGESYSTVQIGDQIWMSENLRYLPQVQSNSEWVESVANGTKAYGVGRYDGSSVSEAKEDQNYRSRGVYYNWWSAVDNSSSSNSNPSDVQGACPAGWHLPSKAEFNQLSLYLGGFDVAGGKMKTDGPEWSQPNVGANNASGFSGKPAGYRDRSGFGRPGSFYINFWTSTELTTLPTFAETVRLLNSRDNLDFFGDYKYHGFKIRCVKN